jgi:hypothetical protein
MSFLHPALLAGAALALVPVLIHLFDRRKLPVQALPTLRFLTGVHKQVKRHVRLRDLLLMLLRAAALALLALLVARPVWNEGGAGAKAAGLGQDVIFVADASFGMHYQLGGKPLFARALAQIGDEAGALTAGQEAALMTCGRRATFISEGFVQADRIAPLFPKLAPGDEAADQAECLRGAVAAAAKSRNKSVEIRLFTNLAAKGWERAELPAVPKDRAVRVTVVDVAGAPLPNRAVLGADLVHGYGTAGEEWVLGVDAGAYVEGARGVAVRAEADAGPLLAQGLIDWDGPGPRRKTLALRPVKSEFVTGRVRLDADALPEDDELPFEFYFGRPVGVLIVDGSPGATAEESESYFPLTALRPGRVQTTLEPRVVTTADLRADDLKGVQVVMLLNVGELGEATVRLLEKFVTGGGGLFWSMGDRVSAESYARAGVLVPGRLRSVRDLRNRNESVALKSFPGQHPIFRDLKNANLATASFTAYQQIEGLQPGARVLLEFADGSPALVDSTLGEGRILWFASTLDDGWTNLPYRPFYLPLLQQAVRYLAGTLKPAMQRTAYVGEKIDLSPYVGAGSAVVRAPGGQERKINAKQTADYLETTAAGLYRVRVGGKPMPEADFVILRRAEASDLARLEPERLQELLGAAGYGGRVEGGEGGARRRLDPALLLLGALGLVLCGEALAARRGRR